MRQDKSEIRLNTPNFIFRKDEVKIWQMDLDKLSHKLPYLYTILSADEKERAARYHFESGQRRFIIGRGVLRTILSRLINEYPVKIKFIYNEFGKPSLDKSEHPECDIKFNLAHSDSFMIAAFSKKREIGIDCELIREEYSDLNIAKRFFSESEFEELTTLPFEMRSKAFFNCWTRKEAFIKATGKGISAGLNSFGVTVHPDKPAKLTFVNGSPEEVNKWYLSDIKVSDGLSATFAVEKDDKQLDYDNYSFIQSDDQLVRGK
jgi:4'-phosphopantetheinyl transferase